MIAQIGSDPDVSGSDAPENAFCQAIADARVQAERAGAELLHKVALAASKGNKPAQYPNEKVRRLSCS